MEQPIFRRAKPLVSISVDIDDDASEAKIKLPTLKPLLSTISGLLLLVLLCLSWNRLQIWTVSVVSSPSVVTKDTISLPPDSTDPHDECLYKLPEDHFTSPHIVAPPRGPVSIVCCETTQGTINFAVHHNWAPRGSARFLDMVREGFFVPRAPLFRALKGFLVQFGLSGDADVQKLWNRKGSLLDDPQWLPAGPTNRVRNGVYRFQEGYLSYAGAGANSRGTQLILALDRNQYLGGGSPWEVPIGLTIGYQSRQVLSKIYTGYGEAPSQGQIQKEGKQYTEREFPLMDYIHTCRVTAENLDWTYRGISPTG